MSNFNKPKTLLVTLLTCVVFSAHAAWWDAWKSTGDDGKANTSGNVAAAKNLAGYKFMIYNKSNSTIAKVVILKNNGQTVYNNKFACNSNQQCDLIVKNINLTTKLTFKFYDSKKQLVSAYLMNDKPGTLNSMIIDDKWLGLYAFNQMVSVTKKDPQVLNTKLTQFFNGYNSPDGTVDIFEELGLYFIAQNGGTNENLFYTTLNKRLDNNQFLAKPQTQKKAIKKAAYKSLGATNAPAVGGALTAQPATTPDNSLCSVEGLQTTFNIIGTLSSFIPIIGDGIGAVFDIGDQIYSSSCSGKENAKNDANAKWIGDKFAEIDDKLKKFNQELNELKYTVDALGHYVDTIDSQNTLIDLNENYGRLTTDYFITYASLSSNTSLVDYVTKNGGLKKSMSKSVQLQKLISSIPSQLNNFEYLLSNEQISKMESSLDNVCKDSAKITGDAIATRIGCNIVVTKVVATIDSSAIRTKAMLNDEITVITDALKSGDIDEAWLKENATSTLETTKHNFSWNEALEKSNKVIDEKIKFVNDTLVGADGSKLYQPLRGFSPQQQKEMISDLNCASDSNPNLPAILEWHSYNVSATDKPYAVTLCNSQDRNNVTRKVKSRFYYQEKFPFNYTRAVNVMGVLVPISSVSKGSSLPMSEKYGGENPNIRMITPKSLDLYSGDPVFNSLNYIINPYNNGFVTRYGDADWNEVWKTPEMEKYFMYPYPKVPADFIMLNYVNPTNLENNGGLSNIWAIKFEAAMNRDAHVQSGYYLSCMDLGCQAVGKTLKFGDGSVISWQNVPAATAEDYVILIVNGKPTPPLK